MKSLILHAKPSYRTGAQGLDGAAMFKPDLAKMYQPAPTEQASALPAYEPCPAPGLSGFAKSIISPRSKPHGIARS
jgi:hypothetical protein